MVGRMKTDFTGGNGANGEGGEMAKSWGIFGQGWFPNAIVQAGPA
jgi:hypothetical protein